MLGSETDKKKTVEGVAVTCGITSPVLGHSCLRVSICADPGLGHRILTGSSITKHRFKFPLGLNIYLLP